jgi:hypothetical protein
LAGEGDDEQGGEGEETILPHEDGLQNGNEW